jgi:release factor glutamine methyltransferase
LNTIGEALAFAQRTLDRIDAQMLAAHALKCSRASVMANAERALTREEAATLTAMFEARTLGVPVAQIIGEREFYGRVFRINEHVLIPRPETELLVELALAYFSQEECLKHRANRRVSGIDLGTGSGAIAISLALENKTIDITAVDKSPYALALARANANALGAQITFIESDWLAALGESKFDLIVSNPPYVARNDNHLREGDLRFEPRMALTDESEDGLASVRAIVNAAPKHLRAGGAVMLEHGYDQAAKVRALLEQSGFIAVRSVADLAGIERVTMGKLPISSTEPHNL